MNSLLTILPYLVCNIAVLIWAWDIFYRPKSIKDFGYVVGGFIFLLIAGMPFFVFVMCMLISVHYFSRLKKALKIKDGNTI